MWSFLSKLIRSKKKHFKEYEFKSVNFSLSEDGNIQYSQWLHPGEFGNTITQERVNFFRTFINKGDFVIDIGANEGDTTVPMSIAAGTEGLTLGLEPNPHVFKILKVNAGLNKNKTNILPLNFAATSEDGEFTFGSGDPSYGNGGIVGFTNNRRRNTRYKFQVQGRNIQNYLLENYSEIFLRKLSFIKIDTEGYDKEILKTITSLIMTYRPYLVVECFGPLTNREKIQLFDQLNNMNYNLFGIGDFDLNSKQKITRANVAQRKTYNILAIPEERNIILARPD